MIRAAVTVSLLIAGAVSTGCGAKDRAAQKEAAVSPVGSSAFASLVDDHFKLYFDFYPSAGTAAGLHQYDNRLEDFSPERFRRRIEELKSLVTRLDAIRKEKLRPEELIDAEVLEGQMKGELLDIESLRSWRRNPITYAGLPGSAVDSLMKRSFAPPIERLRSVTERIKQVPRLLEQLRTNVTDPPKEFTALAARIAKGSAGFFRDGVPAWAQQAAAGDKAAMQDFEIANKVAIQAFETTAKYIEHELTRRPAASYAIGSTAFALKLAFEEMVDIPLKKLLEIGEANLQRDYKEFVTTARKIDASKTPAQVMAAISGEHPTAEKLIPFAKSTLESVRQFVMDKKIVPIPSPEEPIVMETPPYARSGTFASMDTPGPYEKNAKEAYYYVTPPEKDWTRSHVREHLRLFNRPVMDVITIHEAYPGHYVQFLYVKQFPTKTRRLIACGSNAEGWAHYAEQMMLEEGFGGGDLKLKLAQLSEALLRDCRYIVGIKLHTQNMTVEEGARFFVEKGFQERANAYEEARRGAYNPTYLYYTLGKLQVYKLREDYKRARGSAYSLGEFHSEFIRQGGIPVKMIRQILLPGDQGPTL